MASGTIWFDSDISTLQGKIEWSSYSNGSQVNTSTVSATMYIARTDWYTTTGTWAYSLNVGGAVSSDSWYGSVSGDWIAVASVTNGNVPHNNDGTGSCLISGNVDGPSGTSMSGRSTWGSQWVTLDTIPRYANITEFKINSTSLNSIQVKWNADANIDWLEYKLNGGSWKGVSGKTFNINSLSPNTNYSVQIRVRRQDSGLWTESSTKSGKTKDIARISTVTDFNLGDSVRITKTNPSGNTNIIRLETLNPTTTIATRNNAPNDTTIIFSDEELDAIYRKMGTSNSVIIRCVVDTVGDSIYNNYVDKTCTLTGNQKTGHMKIDGSWKRIKHYRKIGDSWKPCVRWIKVEGTWRRCI